MIPVDRARPPRLWLRTARAIVRADRRDEIEGDLIELWTIRAGAGPLRGRLALARDIVSLAFHRHPRRSPIRRQRGAASMLQDLRYAWRLITRQPGFSILAIATLTLGIGASTAIFSIADRVLLRPLPYPELDRIVIVPASISHRPDGISVADEYVALAEFSSMGLYATGGLNLGDAAAPARIRAAAVTSGFFNALGVPPMAGRTFDANDDRKLKVAILSFDAWRRHFGADPAVLGRVIRLNSQPFTVVGVMPRGFTFPQKADVFIPPESDRQITGGAFGGTVIARLAAGVTPRQASEAVTRARASRARAGQKPEPLSVTPLSERLATSARPTLFFLTAVVVLLLLAACSNVAGLLLSRLRSREREFLVRRALGAGRARLVRQLVTECSVLAAVGTAAGFALAVWMVRLFVFAAPGLLPDLDLARIDRRLFLIGASVSTLAAFLFALGPAISASRVPIAQTMREGLTPSRRTRWLGSGLVIGQVAATMVLVIATSAALGTVARLMRIDLGFNNESGVIFEVTLPASRYREESAVSTFVEQLEHKLSGVDGIRRIGVSSFAPGRRGSFGSTALKLADDPDAYPKAVNMGGGRMRITLPKGPAAPVLAASPGYFDAIGIPLLAGRWFNATDDRAGRVVILSAGAARALDPNFRAVVGKHLAMNAPDQKAEIVGVVGNVRLWDVQNDAERASWQIYEPAMASNLRGTVAVVVETSGDPESAIAAARAVLRDIDSELPVYNIERIGDLRARYVATERLTLGLTTAFSAAGILLSAIGLYGVLSQFVSQRTKEIGIRMALGADRGRLRRGVVRQGLELAAAGIAVGALTAFLAARGAAVFVPGLEHPGIAAITVDVAILLGVATFAAWVPARRASAVDPAMALRAD